ncbi:MAG: aminotransferase class III-fold pyridoxal phosphate-dependent enzyme [Planctomycetes bacterium]|nr:aminotransferase class III-fold pyridoxal phosphate-dependent enzyme [Planctomycetota bacterium]
MMTMLAYVAGPVVAVLLARGAWMRLLLSRAKHPSLRGHARWSLRISRWLPFYEYADDEFFGCDGAPADVQRQRRAAFAGLGQRLRERAPRTLALSRELREGVSDVRFVDHYRVPFQFRNRVRDELPLGCVATRTEGPRVQDLDGNWSLDTSGSYGVNVFGYDFYKRCIDRANERARELGPVLGPYHPVIADNVLRLCEIAGKDEVSFHMSGTEAVMQAVRLARYHTRRSHIVRFCGAYHGWWDGVQAGVGNPRPAHEVYTLEDLSKRSLKVLRTRNDIACVLVNPLQALHPNGGAPSDSTLVTGLRSASYDKSAYTTWLRQLREVCTERGIVLIFDEVFLGFRLARGGAQEYFGVQADLVTYGKTLGGGLPVGVVCGPRHLMRRFRDDAPADICFARGTFNSHPYVMAAMNEFLQAIDEPAIVASYRDLDEVWDRRRQSLDEKLSHAGVPVRLANMTAVWTTLFTQPSRYAWLLQYYLRLEGLATSWVGTGRYIFPHDLSDGDFAEFEQRFVRAAQRMRADGWWWCDAATTAKSLGRRVLRETIAAALTGKRRKAGRRVAELGEHAAGAPA